MQSINAEVTLPGGEVREVEPRTATGASAGQAGTSSLAASAEMNDLERPINRDVEISWISATRLTNSNSCGTRPRMCNRAVQRLFPHAKFAIDADQGRFYYDFGPALHPGGSRPHRSRARKGRAEDQTLRSVFEPGGVAQFESGRAQGRYREGHRKAWTSRR